MKFQVEWMLFFLFVAPVFVGCFVYAGWRRKLALATFAEAKLLPLLNTSVSITARRWKAALVVLGFMFIVVAASRPVWSAKMQTVTRTGRDVVFVLDASKSMLAEDLAPNRLNRAKIAINDCIDRLEGDRVGLIVFAGNAVVKCPLTLDYGFFKMMLSDVSTDSIGRGGTMIGDAMRKALTDVFDDQKKEFKDLILITDGEDHESFPLEAAKKLGERGIRLIAIGIGDERNGKRIPITDPDTGQRTFVKDSQGQEVWTKLESEVLKKMAIATPGGRYFNVATGTIDLGDVYETLIAQAEKKRLENQTFKRYEERSQIFIGIALALLCLEMVISERKRRRTEHG